MRSLQWHLSAGWDGSDSEVARDETGASTPDLSLLHRTCATRLFSGYLVDSRNESILMVTVLFADPTGTYSQLSVDLWDEVRDARKYYGDNPVVAHPPCQRWTRLGYASWKRWGGDHNKPGNDNGCFASAIQTVRRVGGVIEHPAFTKAFAAYGIPAPNSNHWVQIADREYICEVLQSQWGHQAQKRTWLFLVSKKRPTNLQPPYPDRITGTHQIGFFDQRGKTRNKPTLTRKNAIHTPLLFATDLITLADKARLI